VVHDSYLTASLLFFALYYSDAKPIIVSPPACGTSGLAVSC
jgi:hypothetical protein